MEHWAQKCDGAGCDPSAFVSVCRERDRLKAKLQSVIATLHDVESEYYEMKEAFDGAKRAMAALNEKLVQITSERDALTESIKRGPPDPCSLCKHNSVGLACDGEGDCALCENKCTCGACDAHASNFEFVGVKKEETT